MEAIKRIVLALLAIVAAYLVFVLIHNLIFGVATRTAPIVLEKAAAAQEMAADWPSEPLRGSAGEPPKSELVRTVRSALPPSLRNHRESAGAPEGAIAAALEFVSMIATGNPDEYAEWREAQGYTFINQLPEKANGDPMADIYDFAFSKYRRTMGNVVGETPPSMLAPRDAFRLLFRAYTRQDGGSLRPVGVTTAPGAAEVDYKRITHPDDHMGYRRDADDGFGSDFWIGLYGGSFVPFFEYKRSIAHLVDRDGGVWYAEVRIATRGARGHVLPTRLWLFHDPEDGWRVRGWGFGNVGENAGVTKAVPVGVF